MRTTRRGGPEVPRRSLSSREGPDQVEDDPGVLGGKIGPHPARRATTLTRSPLSRKRSSGGGDAAMTQMTVVTVALYSLYSSSLLSFCS